jgi:hypothetical protein
MYLYAIKFTAMRKLYITFILLIAGIGLNAQNAAKLRSNLPQAKAPERPMIAIEPVQQNPISAATILPGEYKKGQKGIVSVIPIGTSANAFTYGYGGGQKTMVFADDNLNAVINIHRMGPGTTPPGLSGYLAMDRGINGAAKPGDWSSNVEIYNSTISGGTYFLDAARYPQGVIYNPEGNTDPANAYAIFFAPNLSSTATTWGGLSYGRSSLMDNSDTTKHLYSYNPPPYTYIPDGMDVSKDGVVLVTDIDQDWATGSVVYQGNIIVFRGLWDDVAKDVNYEIQTVELYTESNNRPANQRVAISPDGQTAWIVALANNENLTTPGMLNYYPILFKSTDAGQTWQGPIEVQLDGPNGIKEIVYGLLSDSMMAVLYNPPLPSREEIGYTTAFDCDIVVDKFGNPHIGVIVGVTGNSDYSIVVAEKSFAAFDIYSIDGGINWYAQKMGYPQQFRGNWGDNSEDNRTQIASTMDGTKVFVTWLDTDPTFSDNNNSPNVFCRGFDLMANKTTGTLTGGKYVDLPNNVTLFSDVYNESFFACLSRYVFTDNNKYTIPIVIEGLSDVTSMDSWVQFKYIPDFYYTDADFVFSSNNPGVGIPQLNMLDVSLSEAYPTPAENQVYFSLTLDKSATVSYDIFTVSGQKLTSQIYGRVAQGIQTLQVDISSLKTGIYFIRFNVNGNTFTRKLVVR